MEKIFIGRQTEMDWLKAQVFTSNPPRKFSCSIRGTNGIGKTYLIDHLVEDFNQQLQVENNNTVFIIQKMMGYTTEYYSFMLSIFQDAAECFTEDALDAAPIKNPRYLQELKKWLDLVETIDEENIDSQGKVKIRTLVKKFFITTSNLGYYFILIIDEFDRALQAFHREENELNPQNEQLFHDLFAYSYKSAQIRRLSTILISRRRVGSIAYPLDKGSGSAFDDAFPSDDTVIRGFSPEEMDQYYSLYCGTQHGDLSDKEKNQIDFFCGTHPGMLMELFWHSNKPNTILDIPSYVRDSGSSVRTTYKDMLKLLMNERIMQANGEAVYAISPYCQLFNLTPAYDKNLSTYIEILNDYGFLVKQDHDEKAMEALESSSGWQSITPFYYAPITRNFVLYVKGNKESLEKMAISGMLETTEVNLRGFLRKQLQLKYGDNWEEVIMNFEFQNTEDYWEELNENAKEYGAFNRGIQISILDVLSIAHLGQIIKSIWDDIFMSFPSYNKKSEFVNDTILLTTYRNCCYHHTLKIMSDKQIKKLEEICNRILSDLDKKIETKLAVNEEE